MKIGVIADDFTGANDAGIKFTENGLTSVSLVFGEKADNIAPDILIEDTESRNIEENEAYNRVKIVLENMRENRVSKIYKKIDSTLRGNIKSELKAITEFAQQDDKIVVIVPFPEAGRIVVNGKHFVNSVPLNESEFSKDVLHPITTNDVIELLGTGESVKISNIRKNIEEAVNNVTSKVIVFDAETESDMKIIADFLAEKQLDKYIIGSAGIIKHIAPIWKKSKKTLIVSGSCSDKNIQQMNSFQEKIKDNMYILNLDCSKMLDKNYKLEVIKKIKNINADIFIRNIATKAEMNEIIEKFEKNGYNRSEMGRIIGNEIGEIVKAVVDEYNISDIMISGGETSFDIIKKLGIKHTILINEIETGIPFCLSDTLKYRVITKPGAFGSENIYFKCYEKLKL